MVEKRVNGFVWKADRYIKRTKSVRLTHNREK